MRRGIVAFLCSALIYPFFGVWAGEARIRCASTTSTQNSGLFEHILPSFEAESGIKVDVVAVGTGAALEMGKRGDVDVVFVHDKDEETRLQGEGHFVDRHDVMYNDFVIVGPPDDPAKIAGTQDAAEAFKKIYESGSAFVSRGDGSGTHKTEMRIWGEVKAKPEGKKQYLEVGQGMGKTLRIANEKRAYTLTDRGTWLALKEKTPLDMAVLVEDEKRLFNQYGAMAVNPARHKGVKYDAAMKFIEFLVSPRGQKAIDSFRDSAGNRLFHPNAGEK